MISTVYTHPLSKQTFPSQREATLDYNRAKREAKAAETRRAKQDAINNYLRLHATSVDHVRSLMIDLCAEHAKVNLAFDRFDLTFGWVGTMHAAPIGKPITGWNERKHARALGWEGRISGSLTPMTGQKEPRWYFPELCKSGWGRETGLTFIGLHTGSGGGANSGFGYEFRFYLDDFPLLKARYQDALKLAAERAARQEIEAENYRKAYDHVATVCPKGIAQLASKEGHQIRAKELREQATIHDKGALDAENAFRGLVAERAAKTLPKPHKGAIDTDGKEAAILDATFGPSAAK